MNKRSLHIKAEDEQREGKHWVPVTLIVPDIERSKTAMVIEDWHVRL